MATLDDLFGKKDSKYNPSASKKLQNEGDQLVGVIVTEPEVTPETQFKTFKPKFLVQVNEGEKYKPLAEGEFDPAEVENYFALTQIEFDIKTADGEVFTHRIKGDEKNQLKEAMQDSGLPLAVGVTFAAKVLEVKGNQRKKKFKLVEA